MGVVLSKGGRATLGKNGQKFAAGLSWEEPTGLKHDFDLDATVFVCGHDANGDPKVFNDDEKYMVYYHNNTSPCGAIQHSGDATSGRAASAGNDDETIIIDTQKLPAGVQELGIIITLHEAVARGQNFGQAKDPKIRIYDPDSGAEIASFELAEDFSQDQSVQVGSIYRRGDEWKFNAIGVGFPDRTLADFCGYYGVAVA